VISGAGRFADPWHPFPETSAALATGIQEGGWAVEIKTDADAALTDLGRGPLPSLLVVNIGWYGTDDFSDAATEGLVSALERGLPTLLVHSTLTAFPEWPLWREITGGGWTYGITFHPDYGDAVALPVLDHPLASGLGEQLRITDERYTRMEVHPSSRVFLQHEEEGQRHALAWTRTWGNSPIVTDALGHDADSYRTGDRMALLHKELDWLAAQ
jgi:type 1 glutamine amidotransferase